MNPSPFINAGRKLITFVALGTGALVSLQITAFGQSGPHPRVHDGSGTDGDGLLQPAVSGVVRDASGAPQIGTLVELLSPSLAVIAHTFTDDRGRYALPAVTPGTYEVKASGSFFLPTLRENLRLLANSRLVVNLTLNTLYQAIQWLPARNRSADEPKDDWNWTLRLSTNRPLLRVLEDDNGAGPMILVSDGSGDSAEDRRVTVRSGSNRFGEGGMHQDVEVERDHDDARQLILRTDVGQTDSATIRSTAAYLRQLGPGTAMLTVASYSDRPDVISGPENGLQVFTLRSAATMAFGPDVEAEVGSELEAVHLGQTLAASHPFANLTVRDGQTTIRLRTATSPDAEEAAELDRDSTLTPRVSQRDGALRFEQGSHQQIAAEHRFADGDAHGWTTTLAYFHDSVAHPLIGGGVALLNGRPALAAADVNSGDLLYDPATQLIAVSGGSYAGSGLLAIARDQLTPETWISVRYAVGQALAMELAQQGVGQGSAATSSGNQMLPATQTLEDALGGLRPHTSPMLAASVGSTVHHTRTAWRASYRWQPSDTLTQVAPFDASAPEAYLSFHMRQPIQMHYRAVHGMQAIVDVRNLLAQGYRPFYSQDGSTLYFAQAERCVEGGLSFSF